MTIEELIQRKEQARKSRAGRRDADLHRRNEIASELGEWRARGTLSPAEAQTIEALRAEKAELDVRLDEHKSEIEAMDAELLNLRAEKLADEKLDAQARSTTTPGADRRSYDSETTVTTTSVREPRTYQPAQDSGRGPSFLRDLFNAQVRNDPEALSRLNRHGDEQRVEAPDLVERAVSTGGVAAFTPPAYLVSQWAELSRAGRPIANLCNRSIPLPATGMKVTIPRVTTGTEIEVQAAQGDTLGNQDLDDTALEIPVVSAGGYVDVTWQSLDRGELVQEVVLADLAADYATKLDQQVIYGTGLSGQALGLLGTSGIGAVTYTATTPSLVEMYPKVAELVGKIAGTRFTGATAIAMTPDLWYWMRGVLAEDNRPAIPDSDVGPVNAFGVGGSLEYVETAGKLFAPVVLDGNIPKNLGTGTNETAIIAADWRDVMLLEENGGLPVQMRFDAPLAHQATARLVAWGYFAFTAGRQPSAVAKLTGTGLIRP